MDTLQRIAIWLVPVLFSIIVHEVAHGWMASKLGDNTARAMGRITLNPIPHIDPIGTIFLPLIMLIFNGPVFGWAKPVPFNPYNFYNHINFRKGTLLVALAGPASNFILAFLGSFLLVANMKFLGSESVGLLMQAFVYINLFLAMFNLIPIPPLDGSKILMGILPPKYDYYFIQIERYGFIILMILIVTNAIHFFLIPVQWLYKLFLLLPTIIFFGTDILRTSFF